MMPGGPCVRDLAVVEVPVGVALLAFSSCRNAANPEEGAGDAGR